MSFPNTYEGKIEAEAENKFQSMLSPENLILSFSYFFEEKKDCETIQKNNSIKVKTANPLFFFSFIIKLNFEIDTKITVKYSFTLIEIFKILIALVIFAAFFSNYRADEYLVAVSIFSILFFFANLFFMKINVEKLIREALDFSLQKEKSDFSKEQKQWLLDENKCPACGHEISIYDKVCPDCGIKIRNKAPQKPYNISGDYNNIKYHIKK